MEKILLRSAHWLMMYKTSSITFIAFLQILVIIVLSMLKCRFIYMLYFQSIDQLSIQAKFFSFEFNNQFYFRIHQLKFLPFDTVVFLKHILFVEKENDNAKNDSESSFL